MAKATEPITRFAPTPSGYLHRGNAVNALLVSWQAARVGARLALRIDDMDRERYRPEYVDDILAVTEWLGIGIDLGPSTREEFERSYSLQARAPRYRRALEDLIGSGLTTYACTCSRRQVALGQACRCRDSGHAHVTGESALRVHVPEGTVLSIGAASVPLDITMGDFVVWRRDGQASYQLASLVEDDDMGVTHIVRGLDLLDSSAAQVFLAQSLPAPGFLGADFVHHALVTTLDGTKLSKSQLGSGPIERTDDTRREVHAWAVDIGARCGISPR